MSRPDGINSVHRSRYMIDSAKLLRSLKQGFYVNSSATSSSLSRRLDLSQHLRPEHASNCSGMALHTTVCSPPPSHGLVAVDICSYFRSVLTNIWVDEEQPALVWFGVTYKSCNLVIVQQSICEWPRRSEPNMISIFLATTYDVRTLARRWTLQIGRPAQDGGKESCCK